MKPHHFLTYLGVWLWVALSLNSCNFLPPTPTKAPEYWPTSGWRTTTPEQQGMDAAKLAEMLTEIQDKAYPIHGLVVIRNGYLVLEMYTSPFQAESRHYIASATKSFTSALIGIAVQQGKISRLDAHVEDYFPGRKFENPDARKQARHDPTVIVRKHCAQENAPSVRVQAVVERLDITLMRKSIFAGELELDRYFVYLGTRKLLFPGQRVEVIFVIGLPVAREQ